jgi:myo-inositol-1(or 4)-monophosphatase
MTATHIDTTVSTVASFHYESDDREILAFLHDIADAAADAIDDLTDWSFSGVREGQYSADIAVDDLVLELLLDAGFGVLSEESGHTNFSWPVSGDELMVVVDPVDGSTNAGKGVPWFATSLCVVDKDGLRVALVAEQSGTETRYSAIRGAGALCDGVPMRAHGTIGLSEAVIGVSGLPPADPGWWQFRALGAISLDMCLVAKGALDGYVDFHDHGVWDYLGALLICREAGCAIGEAFSRDLIIGEHRDRRTPIVARSQELLLELLDVRQR